MASAQLHHWALGWQLYHPEVILARSMESKKSSGECGLMGNVNFVSTKEWCYFLVLVLFFVFFILKVWAICWKMGMFIFCCVEGVIPWIKL